MVKAVIGSNSALSDLIKDFPQLANLSSLSQSELDALLSQMDAAIMNGRYSAGWQAAKEVASRVFEASSKFGYVAYVDPTNGATDFKAKSPEEWPKQQPAYDLRKNHPKIWPRYFYQPDGPIMVDSPTFKGPIFLVFDNRSISSKLNPDLLKKEP